MATLFSKSIDEILTLMADVYDGLITPKKLYRNNNNKIWLVFQGIAAGYNVIQDAILALHNRFIPEYCAEEDLYSTAKLVGTEFKAGSGSLLSITITNNDTTTEKTLLAGVYSYTSVTGAIFTFELTIDLLLDALATQAVTAISQLKGAFPVSAVAAMVINRVDFDPIDPAFGFSCVSNAAQLGYPDETPWDFRQRILTDTTRQDIIKEMELAIRNLPEIFECDIVFNASSVSAVYDGITLTPYQMLITLTGAPTNNVALEVASRVVYHTKQIDPDDVVYYYEDHYIDGRYPVYFMYHAHQDFTVEVDYRYDGTKILQTTAETAMNTALDAYRNSNQRIGTLTEDIVYNLLKSLALPSVLILNVDLLVAAVPVPYIDVPKTRLLNLTAATFSGTNVPA